MTYTILKNGKKIATVKVQHHKKKRRCCCPKGHGAFQGVPSFAEVIDYAKKKKV